MVAGTIDTSCWILKPKRGGFGVLCIFGAIYFTYLMHYWEDLFFRYPIPPMDLQWHADRKLYGGSRSDSPEAGEDARIRS